MRTCDAWQAVAGAALKHSDWESTIRTRKEYSARCHHQRKGGDKGWLPLGLWGRRDHQERGQGWARRFTQGLGLCIFGAHIRTPHAEDDVVHSELRRSGSGESVKTSTAEATAAEAQRLAPLPHPHPGLALLASLIMKPQETLGQKTSSALQHNRKHSWEHQI